MTCRYCEEPYNLPSDVETVCLSCDEAFRGAMREYAAKHFKNKRSPKAQIFEDILDAEYLESAE